MSKPTKKPKTPRTPRLPDPNVTAFLFVQRLTGLPPVKGVETPEASPKESSVDQSQTVSS